MNFILLPAWPMAQMQLVEKQSVVSSLSMLDVGKLATGVKVRKSRHDYTTKH